MLDGEKVGHFFAYDQWCCGKRTLKFEYIKLNHRIF